MAPVGAGCLKCDKGWNRDPAAPIGECPGCGDIEWNREYNLSDYIGTQNEYYVVGEHISENGPLMRLDLVGTWNRASAVAVPHCHRRKSYYRHAKNDLGSKNGRGLIVSFSRESVAPNGDWLMRVRQQTPSEARRLVTDNCARHQWAIKVVRHADNVNALGDQMHCSCPADPACEVCTVAAKYAYERRTQPQTGTRSWAPLQHAVMRDLGMMA
jgi:hypothetical protein